MHDICVERTEDNLRGHSSGALHLVWTQGLSPGIHQSGEADRLRRPRVCPVCLPTAGVTYAHHYTRHFISVLGITLGFSCLTISIFNYQVLSPAQHSVALRPPRYKHKTLLASGKRSTYHTTEVLHCGLMTPDSVFRVKS